MAKNQNRKETKKLGDQVKSLREKHNWNIEDISAMTGISRTTISSIESGSNSSIINVIEIAKAIGVQPKQFFDFAIELKPRFKLSPSRNEQKKLTLRVRVFIKSGYFAEPRRVQDVTKYLYENSKIKADSIHLSVILLRQVKDGLLQVTKRGRTNVYLNANRKKA